MALYTNCPLPSCVHRQVQLKDSLEPKALVAATDRFGSCRGSGLFQNQNNVSVSILHCPGTLLPLTNNQRVNSQLLTISTVTKFPASFLLILISLEDDIKSITLGFDVYWPRKSIATKRPKLPVSCNKLKRNNMVKSEDRKNWKKEVKMEGI